MNQTIPVADQLITWIVNQPSLALSDKQVWLKALSQKPVNEEAVLKLTQALFEKLGWQHHWFGPNESITKTLEAAMKYEQSKFSLKDSIIAQANSGFEENSARLKNRFKNAESRQNQKSEAHENEIEAAEVATLKASL